MVAKSADLCWGQRHHVLHYLQTPAEARHDMHIAINHPVPEGTTIAHVRSALTYLVRRHEILRTTYDLLAQPWPQQVVQPPAAPTVHVAGDRPAELIARLTEEPFDITTEWPIRAGVIADGDTVRRLHLVFNHLSLDDVSLGTLTAELDTVLAARIARRPIQLPPVVHQPVDLARHEATLTPSLDHWRRTASELPHDIYASRRTGENGSHAASFTVPSLLATARTIAAEHKVWPSAVHLAAYAITVAAYTGEPKVAFRMYTSQRESSGFEHVLGCASYPTLVVIDTVGPFAEVIKRAAQQVEEAMAYAHVPYDLVVELVAQAGQPRVESELNFLNYAPRSCRTKRDRFVWNAEPVHWAKSGGDTYFRVYEWCDGTTLALQAMADVMSRDDVEHFLRSYAALLQTGATPTFSERPAAPAVTTDVVNADEEAVKALVEAVAEVNGLDRVDPDASYLANGGRALRLPLTVRALRDKGWTDVSLGRLAGARPLRTIADELRRAMNFVERLKKDLTGDEHARFVFVNNFEVERSWAVGEPKLPGAGIAFAGATVNRMEEMGALLADTGDVVVLKAAMDAEFAAYLGRLGAAAGRTVNAEVSSPELMVTEDALNSPLLLEELRKLADGRTYLMPLGISAAEEELAKETGLPLAGTTAQTCKAVNGKIFSRQLVESIGIREVPGRVVHTVGELRPALEELLADGGRVVVKESLGVSGRGMVVVADEKAASRLLRLIERRGLDAPANLVVETWIEHAQDLNYQFVVSRTGNVRFETVKAAVLKDGVHQGHRFPVELPAVAAAELQEAVQKIGKALHEEGFFGLVGVDAMLATDGTLYPCLEINARFNMSTYQSRIAERFIPDGAHAIAATFGLRPSRVHSFTEVADALGDLLLDEGRTTGVLVNNFATLNAAATDGSFHGRLYAICVAESADAALELRQEAEARLQRMVGNQS
ncbi:condensation domain-containing protein [Kutzneria chonburiensis]|uniref:Condensation domain-containing protein n=1 Tax=Kutzneria chonburiensis TaxID=1483604 RepID=A0ABV6MLN6_9PSEU|nr:condensation domain-containing protein [Kutzneria chonburiensis]